MLFDSHLSTTNIYDPLAASWYNTAYIFIFRAALLVDVVTEEQMELIDFTFYISTLSISTRSRSYIYTALILYKNINLFII